MLRAMILEGGKKPYLLALGKLNPAKVANFSECDVFCLIACPESTVVDNRVPLPIPQKSVSGVYTNGRIILNRLLRRMSYILRSLPQRTAHRHGEQTGSVILTA